jgi:Zn-finger nucleic acid-binding protein
MERPCVPKVGISLPRPLASSVLAGQEDAMKCPVDDTVLAISDRQGIEIDYCPTCRGVWLDRGELEKLIARATREFDEFRPRRDHDDDDDDRYRHPRRKRSFFESLGEIFD